MPSFFGPIEKEADEIFNYCTKYLIRERSNSTEDNKPTEGWRFPLVMTLLHGDFLAGRFNEVTFIYHNRNNENIESVSIIGNFLPLYQSLPLQQVVYDGEKTNIYYLTLILPVGKGFHYRFLINGKVQLDPINPQRVTLPNGKDWSFFFTDYFNYSADFEEWEINLLYRLVEQIVPFRTEEAQNFINRFYQNLSRQEKDSIPIYKLDQSVGEVNYITNILAREERHHLIDYKICIRVIDQLLRKRNPYVDSWLVSEEMINDLYNEMANENNRIQDWDYGQYNNPTYFLKLLRRHCITGAFCHPRHGGNIGGAGWNYLKEKYCVKDATGKVIESYFNWDLAMEMPLGKNPDYRG
jgi:hypothetical protein